MFTTLLALALLAATGTDHVYVDPMSGEVTLAAHNDVLREMPRVAKWDVITDMVIFRGRLLAVASMDFDGSAGMLSPYAYSDGAQVLEFSPDTGDWSVLHDQEASMFFNARVVGDRLMLPEYYPLAGRSRMIHTYDGKDWDALGLLPEQNWHVMDVAGVGEKLYASGAWRDDDTAAQGSDPRWWSGYGHVFESADAGKTWTDIRRTRENGRVLDMVEFHDKLYANERGMELIRWNGKSWDDVPVKLESAGTVKLGNASLAVCNGRIVAYHGNLYYTYDGKKWESYVPGFLDVWVEGKSLYGLRESGIVARSDDLVKWEVVTREGVPAKDLDRKAELGHPLHRGSLALHRGRLFVGTGAEGKIWAAPYETRGHFTPDAVRFDASDAPALAWEVAGPGVKVQYRTGSTVEDVERATWKDATESPVRIEMPKKHVWAQCRATLEGDGTRSPVLRKMTLGK